MYKSLVEKFQHCIFRLNSTPGGCLAISILVSFIGKEGMEYNVIRRTTRGIVNATSYQAKKYTKQQVDVPNMNIALALVIVDGWKANLSKDDGAIGGGCTADEHKILL